MMVSDRLASWRAVSKPAVRLAAMIALIVILLVLGLTPFVDNFMHIGGLLMEFLAAFMLLPNFNFGRCEGIVHTVLALLAFPAAAVIFMVSLVTLFRRVGNEISWCEWCAKVTCVNIKDWCAPYLPK
jgi:hypothetical protein